jgi:hypothetical protein
MELYYNNHFTLHLQKYTAVGFVSEMDCKSQIVIPLKK